MPNQILINYYSNYTEEENMHSLILDIKTSLLISLYYNRTSILLVEKFYFLSILWQQYQNNNWKVMDHGTI